jgi:outer membrane protein OmpA-like peptidoglycan-associated protein
MKRLAALVGPYKEAIASNGSDVEKLKELFAAVKTALGKRQFAQAVEALDALERLLAQQKAPSGVAGLDTGRVDAGGSEPAGPAGPGKHCPPDGALESTSTIIYFCWDSADLTPSARKSLDDYAKAYLEAKSTSEVSVDGYASTDGDDQHNKKLALKRAKAVADYLSQKGVKAKQPQGHPETDEFSKDDPRQNRRAGGQEGQAAESERARQDQGPDPQRETQSAQADDEGRVRNEGDRLPEGARQTSRQL